MDAQRGSGLPVCGPLVMAAELVPPSPCCAAEGPASSLGWCEWNHTEYSPSTWHFSPLCVYVTHPNACRESVHLQGCIEFYHVLWPKLFLHPVEGHVLGSSSRCPQECHCEYSSPCLLVNVCMRFRWTLFPYLLTCKRQRSNLAV